ncbi:hypothetical protein GGR28_001086 [Lewinella aquimaris]|uniref:Class IIb bacteriocin, lactobin A/cerein 7B family n=1 Tax=Neolewinella aquimaris TaxID=1835722 RepID=A0A840E3D1_9BACT|nr:hypothetical protein [Neolewinella aquimaris]MBB4078473.1 hypothetical protein [Neolewinella aquimaris]
MKNLSIKEVEQIDGGFLQVVWKAFTAAATFVLGKGVLETVEDGWTDPYGID